MQNKNIEVGTEFSAGHYIYIIFKIPFLRGVMADLLARYTDTNSLHGRLLSGEVRNHRQTGDNKDSEEMFKEKVSSHW